MIDLCKLFGVEEGEEFKVELESNLIDDVKYRVINNIMEWSEIGTKFEDHYHITAFYLNDVNKIKNIIKLPKKKEFTDEELCILRNIDKWYKWIARSRGNVIMLHNDKPYKDHNIWNSINCEAEINAFNHLFKSIKWEDEEPVRIDDYVERGKNE